MIITNEQKKVLLNYDVKVSDDINETLLALDAKITEIGFNRNYSLNDVGRKLQNLYDELFYQN